MPIPELIPFHGDWDRYEDELYDVYTETLSRAELTAFGQKVQLRHVPMSKGKGFGFWHIISEGKVESERTINFRRCERIRWVAWIIANATTESCLTWWPTERDGRRSIVIWAEQEGFAVILAQRNGYLLLVTAYCVQSRRAAAFRKEREAYLKAVAEEAELEEVGRHQS